MKIEVEKTNKTVEKNLSNLGAIAGIIATVSILFILAPGFFLTLVTSYFWFFKTGQLWGLMIIGSIAIYFSLFCYFKNFKIAIFNYLLLSGGLSFLAIMYVLIIESDGFMSRSFKRLFYPRTEIAIIKDWLDYSIKHGEDIDGDYTITRNLPNNKEYELLAPSEKDVCDEYLKLLVETIKSNNDLQNILQNFRNRKEYILSLDDTNYFEGVLKPQSHIDDEYWNLSKEKIKELFNVKEKEINESIEIIVKSQEYGELYKALSKLSLL